MTLETSTCSRHSRILLGEVTMSWRTKLLTAAIGLGVALSIGLSAAPAEARFFGGVGFGYPRVFRPFFRPLPGVFRPLIPPPPYVGGPRARRKGATSTLNHRNRGRRMAFCPPVAHHAASPARVSLGDDNDREDVMPMTINTDARCGGLGGTAAMFGACLLALSAWLSPA